MRVNSRANRTTSLDERKKGEVALAAIEAGSMDAGKFAQGINSYVSTICEELLSLAPASRQQSYPSLP